MVVAIQILIREIDVEAGSYGHKWRTMVVVYKDNNGTSS